MSGGNVWAGIAVGAAIGAATGFMAHYAMGAGMAAYGIKSISEATILQGILIGSAGGAVGGFGMGMASGYAGGASGSFGDMLASGGWGALSGYISGGVSGGLSSSQFWNGISGKGWFTGAQLQEQSRRIANMMGMLDQARSDEGLFGQIKTLKLIVEYNTNPSPASLANLAVEVLNNSSSSTMFSGYLRSVQSWGSIGNGSPYYSGIRTPFTSAAMGGLLLKPLITQGLSITTGALISPENPKVGLVIYKWMKFALELVTGGKAAVPVKYAPGVFEMNPEPAY